MQAVDVCILLPSGLIRWGSCRLEPFPFTPAELLSLALLPWRGFWFRLARSVGLLPRSERETEGGWGSREKKMFYCLQAHETNSVGQLEYGWWDVVNRFIHILKTAHMNHSQLYTHDCTYKNSWRIKTTTELCILIEKNSFSLPTCLACSCENTLKSSLSCHWKKNKLWNINANMFNPLYIFSLFCGLCRDSAIHVPKIWLLL